MVIVGHFQNNFRPIPSGHRIWVEYIYFKRTLYFQSFSLNYGIDAGLVFFKERIRLAKELSKCTKHLIYILTIKQAVSSALVDTGEKVVSECFIELINDTFI